MQVDGDSKGVLEIMVVDNHIDLEMVASKWQNDKMCCPSILLDGGIYFMMWVVIAKNNEGKFSILYLAPRFGRSFLGGMLN